ncbi:alpha-2-macroglobulin-like protein 1 [Dendropsophus ebraccatus]|uniref:alpha-2-macroglobulin-like protein 1 n=1 Tax=Dendropsophus ebraccatus TaxID=150705 RepID=UPI0038321933
MTKLMTPSYLTAEGVERILAPFGYIEFGPGPKMIGFFLLKNGFVTADRVFFKVEKCLPNMVRLKFAQTEASPKDQLSLQIKSSPGSLCSIRAVDKSVQIYNEDEELTEETVFNLFKYSVRYGYPGSVQESILSPCWRSMIRLFPYIPWDSFSVDVLTLFKEIGVKILTNTRILQPLFPEKDCYIIIDNKEIKLLPNNGARNFFPDTWLWNLVPVGELGCSSIDVTVPNSIGQFNARAFCMGDSGFGLSPQVSLTVFKPFLVDFSLPYSIIQGEKILLNATVFNYLTQCLMVQVTLLSSADFSVENCKDCVKSSCVCASQAVTFGWNITANIIGSLNITMRAEAVTSVTLCNGKSPYVPDDGNVDTLQRQLLVKPGGIRKEKTENMYICLNDSVDTRERISLTLPSTWVEKSKSAYISVLGDILGTALNNLENLIKKPFGCGEQNMVTVVPIIYVLDYLKATGQLSATQKDKGIEYLRSGYQRQLKFRSEDGSYSAFGNGDQEGSTWLTAFVLKSFYQAKAYIFIDNNVLNQAMGWLSAQQEANGCFKRIGRLYNTAMKGGVENDISLSAYITVALLERGTPGNDSSLVRALSCLKNKANTSVNPYTMAILAYTFALTNDSATKRMLLNKLLPRAESSGEDLYWKYPNQTSASANVELTSYVLLALTTSPSSNDISNASRIANWLIKQQNPYGGFFSTQDTVVGIQALAKYARIKFIKGALSVKVSKNRQTLKEFAVNETNRLLLQTSPLPDIPGEYGLLVRGKGCVYIQSVLKYNVVPELKTAVFDIRTTIEDCNSGDKVLLLTISVRYNGKRTLTNMVLIKVEMLSGYKLLSDYEIYGVKKTEIEKDSVNIYLDGLDRTERQMILILQKVDQVKDLRPAYIEVYDYYQGEESSATSYRGCL